MSGNLDNLINKVIIDAEREAQAILNQAADKKSELLNEKKQAVESEQESVMEKAKRDAALLKEQMISNATLRARDEQLHAKREILESVFDKAMTRLSNMDVSSYLAFLETELQRLSLKGTELLVVPERYLAAVGKLDLPIKLAQDKTCPSGYQIIDKNYIIDHSFRALLDFHQEDLEVEVARLLFKKQEG